MGIENLDSKPKTAADWVQLLLASTNIFYGVAEQALAEAETANEGLQTLALAIKSGEAIPSEELDEILAASSSAQAKRLADKRSIYNTARVTFEALKVRLGG